MVNYIYPFYNKRVPILWSPAVKLYFRFCCDLDLHLSKQQASQEGAQKLRLRAPPERRHFSHIPEKSSKKKKKFWTPGSRDSDNDTKQIPKTVKPAAEDVSSGAGAAHGCKAFTTVLWALTYFFTIFFQTQRYNSFNLIPCWRQLTGGTRIGSHAPVSNCYRPKKRLRGAGPPRKTWATQSRAKQAKKQLFDTNLTSFRGNS